MMKLKGMTKDSINSIMSSHTPVSALKDEYLMVLSHKVSITDDAGNRYIPHRVVIDFLLSDECRRINQHILNTRLMSSQSSDGNIDSDYIDKLGEI